VVREAGGVVWSDTSAAQDATAEYADVTARQRVEEQSLAQLAELQRTSKRQAGAGALGLGQFTL
jgi:hypothetical protein